ncbi:uncharacterized protein PG998_015048 [Apiospora kogelbergensis]|uniref:uncharacterized protein n=1 Tax=Apiospora kogelbergensis TaxID=1337665 RepID=UPI0031319BC4
MIREDCRGNGAVVAVDEDLHGHGKIDNIFKILIFQNDTTGSARGAAHPERLAYDDNVSNIDNAGSFLCGSH